MHLRAAIASGLLAMVILAACGSDKEPAPGAIGSPTRSPHTASLEPEPTPAESDQPTPQNSDSPRPEEAGLVLWVEEDFEVGPGVMGIYSDGLTTSVEDGRYWMVNTTGGMQPSPISFPDTSGISVQVDIVPPSEFDVASGYTDNYGILVREGTDTDAASYAMEFWPPGAIQQRAVLSLIRTRVVDGERNGTVLASVDLDGLEPVRAGLQAQQAQDGTLLTLTVDGSVTEVTDSEGIGTFGALGLTVTARDGTPVGWDNLEVWVDATN